jgi:thioesterase domain-containing protein
VAPSGSRPATRSATPSSTPASDASCSRSDGAGSSGATARHRLWYAYQKHWELVGPSWKGAPYDGEITLFWSEDTASADATMGWGALGASVTIHRLPVDHERIMDEHEVHHLAGPLRDAIDATRGRPETGPDGALR